MHVDLVSLSVVPPNPTVRLDELPAVIGRGDDADVKLCDCWASRRHCEVTERDGLVVVRDIGSRHGTFVNGRRLDEAVVHPGDEMTIGISTFRIHYQAHKNK